MRSKSVCDNLIMISGQVNIDSTIETADLGLIPGRVNQNYKNWYPQQTQQPCLTFSIIRDIVKLPPLVVNTRAGGNLTPFQTG